MLLLVTQNIPIGLPVYKVRHRVKHVLCVYATPFEAGGTVPTALVEEVLKHWRCNCSLSWQSIFSQAVEAMGQIVRSMFMLIMLRTTLRRWLRVPSLAAFRAEIGSRCWCKEIGVAAEKVSVCRRSFTVCTVIAFSRGLLESLRHGGCPGFLP